MNKIFTLSALLIMSIVIALMMGITVGEIIIGLGAYFIARFIVSKIMEDENT